MEEETEMLEYMKTNCSSGLAPSSCRVGSRISGPRPLTTLKSMVKSIVTSATPSSVRFTTTS